VPDYAPGEYAGGFAVLDRDLSVHQYEIEPLGVLMG
jgi:hypothetical protein